MQNITSSIVRSYFAKWSFPYHSPFANLSKLLMPASNYINSNIEKSALYASIKYRNTLLESLENIYVLNIFEDAPALSCEFISKQYLDGTYATSGKIRLKEVGDYEDVSFMQYPVKGGALIEVDKSGIIKNDFVCPAGETFIDKTFPEEVSIYIYPTDTNGINKCWLYGNDSDGEILVEEIIIHKSNIATESKFKFRSLLKVVSQEDINISTYLDLKQVHSVESQVAFPKRFTNNDGEFVVADIEIDEDHIHIYDVDAILRKPIISFGMDEKITHAYLTSNMDVFTLSETGSLNVSKPTPYISEITNVNGTMNDNRYLYIEDEISRIGRNITAVFYPYRIAAKMLTSSVKVSIENNGTAVYLDKNGQMTLDANTWISISDMNDIVRLNIECDNPYPYIVKVVSDEGEFVCAAAYQDNSNTIGLINNVSDMILYDGELIIYTADKLFKFKPSRCVMLRHGQNRLVVDSEYLKVEEV